MQAAMQLWRGLLQQRLRQGGNAAALSSYASLARELLATPAPLDIASSIPVHDIEEGEDRSGVY